MGSKRNKYVSENSQKDTVDEPRNDETGTRMTEDSMMTQERHQTRTQSNMMGTKGRAGPPGKERW